jgi:thiamine-phosphate pyrophosphorylase
LGPEKIIGVSVRTLAEALAAARDGADYLGVGPIYATGTKPDAGQACGLDVMTEIKKRVNLPVVAIGGITLANAPRVIAAGADMVSAISAVVADRDAEAVILRLKELFT